MSKKQKRPPQPRPETAELQQERDDRILSEIQRTGDALKGDVGRTVASLKENLSGVATTAVESSAEQLKGILGDVEQLGNRMLEDISGSLDAIKADLVRDSDHAAKAKPIKTADSKKASKTKAGKKGKSGKGKAGRKKSKS